MKLRNDILTYPIKHNISLDSSTQLPSFPLRISQPFQRPHNHDQTRVNDSRASRVSSVRSPNVQPAVDPVPSFASPPLDPDSPNVAPRYRCVTYIKKSIPAHFISQLNSLSSLVTAIQIIHLPDSPPHHTHKFLPPTVNHISDPDPQALSLPGRFGPSPARHGLEPTPPRMESTVVYPLSHCR